ncbi:hypothetical protein IUY40_13490 [Flavobacterium sp. ALJ2]|uniref:hypothetical protein n=1 Tax=Flavobacterium sp. ALJ2 TaxID=2786960 RepID=UPI00189D653A|nr:hypothetical protein [Flavobacterium sp. ALJ2]MBF7092545.1 hypothetical protein [Flavobacterium sp. ALJ2]
MKYIYVYLFTYLFAQSCNAQKDIIKYDMYSYNLIAFMDKINVTKINNEFLKINNIHFVKVRRYSDIPRPTYLEFYQKKDTMTLILVYRNTGNLIFENLKFKKGKYKLIINPDGLNRVKLKNEYKVNDEIYFENLFDIEIRKRKDCKLNEVLFYKINLKDTINVKFEQIK